MKLKNKRTGEIGTLIVDGAYKFVTNFAVEDDEGNRLGEYNSLTELNEEWDDYEEPKEIYYLTERGVIDSAADMSNFTLKMMEEIGNYFETQEEAELAVRKLKAWKRLEDKGFRFMGWGLLEYGGCDRFDYSPHIGFSIPNLDKDEPYEYPEEVEKDLDICFGGEE